MDVIKELLSSKKFDMAVLGMVAYVAGKLGLHFDTAEAFTWISPLIAAIVGQGIADHGKEAAKLMAAGPCAPPLVKAGRIENVLMVLLAVAGLSAIAVSLPGCGAAQRAALVSCTEDAAAKNLEPTVESILTTGVNNWQAQLEALAKAFGSDELDCVVAYVKSYLAPKVGVTAGVDVAGGVARADQWLHSRGK